MSNSATAAQVTAAFQQAMAAFDVGGHLAVAVSGGPDSMALLALCNVWAKSQGVALSALTINHQLRAEAAAEAAMVAQWCAAHDVSHHILEWQRAGGLCGNLQAAARQARYRLMGMWCAQNGVTAVAVAHHADDQAETLVMRLARGSGVDGLAAMAANASWPVMLAEAPRLLRPLLNMRRADLVAYGQEMALPVAHDPSNEDAAFDRVATRQIIAALDLDVERLGRTADLLGAEKQALDWAMGQAFEQVVEISPHGFVTLDRAAFAALPAALGGRVLRHLLHHMGTASYPPRREALARLRGAVVTGEAHSLAGVSLAPPGVLFPEHLPKAQKLPLDREVKWGPCFSFAATQEGWQVTPRSEVAGAQFTAAQMAKINGLTAPVRPVLPVLVDPDGRPYLVSFGETHAKVSVFNHLRAALTVR